MKSITRAKEELLVREETLVDRAFKLDTEIKAKNKELNELKTKIKDYALSEELSEIDGVNAIAKFSDVTEWDVDLKKLESWLKAHKNYHLFFSLLKPSITEIKKYLGEYALDDFAVRETKHYAKLKFVEKK